MRPDETAAAGDRATRRGKLPPRRLADAGKALAAERPIGPGGRPLCRWCDLEILAARRRTFCSAFCVHQWRLRSDPGYLREQVLLRDRGVCALCATDTLAAWRAMRRMRGTRLREELAIWGLSDLRSGRQSLWDADHVLPVAEGGGACDLSNLRTLCLACHREVTADLRRRLERRSGPERVGESGRSGPNKSIR